MITAPAYHAQPITSIILDEMTDEAYQIAVLHQSAARHSANKQCVLAARTRIEATARENRLEGIVRESALHNGRTYGVSIDKQAQKWRRLYDAIIHAPSEAECRRLDAEDGVTDADLADPQTHDLRYLYAADTIGHDLDPARGIAYALLFSLLVGFGLVALSAGCYWAFAPMWTQGANF